jgi:cell division protein FtsL
MRGKSGRDRYSVKLTVAWVTVLIVCLLEIYFYTWFTVQYTRLQLDIGQQKKLESSLAAEKKELRIEIVRLKSPARITGIAREQLGMVIPETDQVMVIP